MKNIDNPINVCYTISIKKQEEETMTIATIYNDLEAILIEVLWDAESGAITYRDTSGCEWSADESADTLEKAMSDTFDRYSTGWDLTFTIA